jgi:hypothetical protein
LLVFVGLIVVAMFALTFYNLSAPRSTLKNVLGQKRRGLLGTLGFTAPKNANANTPPVSQHVIDSLGLAARVGKRTTRTTLAITGFSLLGVIVVAVFGVSGEGVRDLRNQVVTAVTTLVATIAGFYFGSDAGKNSNNNPPPPAATTGTPASLQPDPITEHSQFTIGTQGAYTPQVGGTPQVTISTTDALPAGLELDPSTGAITGTPTGAPGVFAVTLTAHNAFPPDATLDVTITITA